MNAYITNIILERHMKFSSNRVRTDMSNIATYELRGALAVIAMNGSEKRNAQS